MPRVAAAVVAAAAAAVVLVPAVAVAAVAAAVLVPAAVGRKPGEVARDKTRRWTIPVPMRARTTSAAPASTT